MAPKHSNSEKLLLIKGQAIIESFNYFQGVMTPIEGTQISNNFKKQIETELSIFNPLFEQYSKFLLECRAAELEFEDFPTMNEFRGNYTRLKAAAEILLDNNATLPPNETTLSYSSNSSRSEDNIKLPIISLPSFDGAQETFRGFIEVFEALVGSNPKLTCIEKFLYLKNALKGPAKQIVSELKATEINYQIAIELLKERYDNKKTLIFSHFDLLLESPKLTKESQLRSFYDNFIIHIRAVDNENIDPSEYKNAILAYITKSKVDNRTGEELAKRFPKRIPSVQEISKFLSERCNMIDETSNSKSASHSTPKPRDSIKRFSSESKNPTYTFVQSNSSCTLCKGEHFINSCPSFLNLSIKARFNKTRSLKLCTVCLRHSYKIKCNSSVNCSICQQRHNRLLCFKGAVASNSETAAETPGPSAMSEDATPSTSENNDTICGFSKGSEVLLSTIRVTVISGDKKIIVRGLLDTGSQNNLISQGLQEKLKSPCRSINLTLKGINSATSSCSKYTTIQIQSMLGSFKAPIDCLIVPTITDKLPAVHFNKDILCIPPNLHLADNSYNEPGNIDLLIGSSMFYKLLLPENISLGVRMPTLQNTLLGWVVSGDLPKRLVSQSQKTTVGYESSNFTALCCHTTAEESNLDLHQSLTRFWNMDNPEPSSKLSLLSPEQKFCEIQFQKTVSIDESGHLSVSVPFNSKLLLLGDSRRIAEKRFLHLERRLCKNPNLHIEYSRFMSEYEQLGHMSKISEEECFRSPVSSIETTDGLVNTQSIPPQFYPHHAVIKQSSLTTKLRVVFDASVKSDTGVSVNDAQVVGPQIQDDLVYVLLRFRAHEIAVCGDIAKMYRMINVRPEFRKFQHILWRENPQQPISIFRLNTITYGTAAASFLSTRCLLYLADLNKHLFPEAARVISKNFYMDDLLLSTDCVEKAVGLIRDVSSILSTAGFTIRKFLSNKSAIFTSDCATDIEFATIPIGERSHSKTLGLHWDSERDYLFCAVEIFDDDAIPTKRQLLSIISKVFDPLGLFAPATVQGKLIMQSLWQSKLHWDDLIPSELVQKWSCFRTELAGLKNIKVSRCLIPSGRSEIQLHGFCDASNLAYGCCFYLRCRKSPNEIFSNLILAKSRVAPLRTVSIPRLELCAAVLMANWSCKIVEIFSIQPSQVFLWSDSKIVLSWIRSTPNKYKAFVANRVAIIQECTNIQNWHHVSTSNNPADLVSRGLSVVTLKNNHLWYRGPDFLTKDELQCHPHCITPQDDPKELKNPVALVSTVSPMFTFVDEIFRRFSTLGKLKRVVAYVLRFVHNCRNTGKLKGELKLSELRNSLKVLTKLCQQTSFPREIKALKNAENITGPRIQSLNPFLDKDGCIRVGGRLSYSEFPYEKKHPLLLPKGHIFTELIIQNYHKELLHCGSQILLASIRECFWPIGGLNYIKGIIRNCTACFKAKPFVRHPLMSDLPKDRLKPVYPFYHVGVDYAGPILLKDRLTRGSRLCKGYICVFVCMVTTAIHLELVTALSTDAFLSTLKRFIARRGLPATIYSDNATNFRGAKAELDSLYKVLHNQESQNKIINYLHSKSIEWHFINPRSPHEGGLWESSVKFVKMHLRRILGNSNLTFEHMYTALTMIEAVLNSKPLSYMSSDSKDPIPLTPGHFLIGRPLTSAPVENLLSIAQNRLSIYQRAQQMVQHFWRRWSREVVAKLQQRLKWNQRMPELLQVDSVVLLQEDHVPPMQWQLGRVVELHPSLDKVVRSASVRLSNQNIVRRSVRKLCVLPNE